MLIYKVTNNLNNKAYIGLTTQTLEKRKSSHLTEIKKGRLSHLYFYRAIKKHGIENFSWEILTETDSKSKLKALEKFYIAAYSKMTELYNMTNGGELIEYRLTDAQRKAISYKMKNRIVSDETKEKLRQANLGKKQSEETKLKRSQSLKGRPSPMKGKKQSERFKQIMIGCIPWNKGIKLGKGYYGNRIIDVKNEKNPAYRHDVKDEDIRHYLNDGLSKKEISIIMNCSISTIKKRIYKMVL